MRCKWRWMIVLAMGFAIGCGDSGNGTIVLNQDEDVGIAEDVEGDDVAAPEDVEEDVEPDVDPGIPIDGEGDNCPEISNPDQSDRSRDGIGDACANFPFYHDPSNPEEVPVFREEWGPPNDLDTDARTIDPFDLPLMIEGRIGQPVAGTPSEFGDVDYYAIEIDEPTTLLIHLEAATSALWPTMIVAGDPVDNISYQSVVVAPNRGESEVRDVHLPVAGRYFFVISDYENLTGGSVTGGPNYGYQFAVSTPELPEPEVVPVPTPRQVVSYESREATVFTVDVAGEDAIKVEASGAPRNAVSVVLPAIQILDADTGDVLAYTLEDQINRETLRGELTLKLSDDIDAVDVLVEAHTSLGDNDIVVDISVFDKPEHLASMEDPRESREDNILWLSPSMELASEIGPPRAISDTNLTDDRDFFFSMVQPGDYLRVVAEPHAGGQLIPEVAVGRLPTSFFSAIHTSNEAILPGESTSLSFLVTEDRQRELAFRNFHADNWASTLPVGGPDYGYDLRVEKLSVVDNAQRHDEFPATIALELEPGEHRIYDFPFQDGYLYRVDYQNPDTAPVELIDTEDWRVFDSTTGETTFVQRPDRDAILAVRDISRVGLSESAGGHLEVTEVAGPEEVEIPHSTGGTLDDDSPQAAYRLSASAGETVVARAVSDVDSGAIVELVGHDATPLENDDDSFDAVYLEEDSDLIAIVTRQGDESVDYSLAIESIDYTQETAPLELRETLDELSSGWWRVDLEEDTTYGINAPGGSSTTETMWLAVYDAESRELLAESKQGVLFFDSRASSDIVVATADPAGPVDAPADVGLSVAPVEPVEIDASGTSTVELINGLRPAVVRFHHQSSGMSTLEIDADGDQEASALLANALFEPFVAQAPDQPLAAMARAGDRHWTGLVVPRDVDDEETWTAEVKVENTPVTGAQVLDTEEAVAGNPMVIDQWPAAYFGSIDFMADPRTFLADVEEGSNLWVVTMPAPSLYSSATETRLTLSDATGQVRAVDTDSADFSFSAIHGAEIDEEGPWLVELTRDNFNAGEFAIFFVRQDE